MTFPNPYNGIDTSFNFAGGICWAGFADLNKFYEDSWISDWLVDFLGPFDEAKYRDRSPVHHMEKLRGPLYISHGANDRRVPISTMTESIERLAGTPYQHRVIIQDGEGHGAAGVENEIKHLAQMFDTIDEWLKGVDSVHASN
jgi:dipeptidyl aminopeptidase/acylaminoacyl peptidase